MEVDKAMKPAPTSKLRTISDTAFLALTTVALLGVYATSYLANIQGSIFRNTTAQVSDEYTTQVRAILKLVWDGAKQIIFWAL